MDYRREIDGLRALAVLPVILFHAGFETFGGGFIGVDVFFVISGYLITTIILSELEQGKFSIINFYERRARRILPALFLVMLVSIPFAWFLLLPQDLVSFSKSLVSISVFASNILFWTERGYFSTATELKPLIHTWSLAVEEQYYLLFPLFLIFFSRKMLLRNVLLSLLFIASFGLSVWLTDIHQDTAFFLLPMRLWELLVGSIVAIALSKKRARGNLAGGGYMASAIGILGILLILYSIFFFDRTTLFPGSAAFVPVFGSALIIVFATESTVPGKLLGGRGFVFIGLLSYSAYLWHQPLFAFVRYYNLGFSDLFGVVLIFMTFGLSFLSWKYIEQPWRKSLFSRNIVFISSLAGITFFAVIGIIGVVNKGFLERYSKEEALVFENTIDAGEYVRRRFNRLLMSQFDLRDVKKKKIVIIGDSYGQDLVNALYEGGFSEKLQISTYRINSECGNIYLTEGFTQYIDAAKLPRCRLLGWYDNDKLISLILQSDSIWLASSWSPWVAERLPKSVENLERDFGKPVIVFGVKNFGEVDVRRLLRVPISQRVTYTNTMSSKSIELQIFMREALNEKYFIDIGSALCGANFFHCRLFNDQGEPLTFDGTHLTRAGARELGKALSENHLLTALLN